MRSGLPAGGVISEGSPSSPFPDLRRCVRVVRGATKVSRRAPPIALYPCRPSPESSLCLPLFSFRHRPTAPPGRPMNVRPPQRPSRRGTPAAVCFRKCFSVRVGVCVCVCCVARRQARWFLCVWFSVCLCARPRFSRVSKQF